MESNIIQYECIFRKTITIGGYKVHFYKIMKDDLFVAISYGKGNPYFCITSNNEGKVLKIAKQCIDVYNKYMNESEGKVENAKVYKSNRQR